MVAFLLPITWAFTGAAALGVINQLGSWMGLTGLAFDDWKLRKCDELGVEPESIKQFMTLKEAERLAAAVAIGAYRHLGTKHVFVLDDESARKNGLAGEYCLLDRELSLFLDGLRHLELVDGVGASADRLRELIKGSGLPYEAFSFLWEGFDCDFAKLRKLSKARLEQEEWFEVSRWLMQRRASKV